MKFIFRRLIFYVVALWATITLNFFLPRLMPGTPAQALMAKFAGRLNPLELKSIAIAFGLDVHQSLWQQYVTYLGQLAHGNLGVSLTFFPTPVIKVVEQALPWTIGLVGISTVISFILGMAMGGISSWYHGKSFDSITTTFFTFTYAFPYFWIALAVLYGLGYLWGVFPLSGAYTNGLTPGFNGPFLGSVIGHAILPALTIVFTSVGYWAVTMRNTMVATISQDYVSLAVAKGLKTRKVLVGYAGRNALLPNLTGFAMSLGFIVSGAILTEIVFSYPGVGYLLYQAVQQEDYPLIQGILLIIAISVLCANFLADLMYAYLDPRVSKEGNQ